MISNWIWKLIKQSNSTIFKSKFENKISDKFWHHAWLQHNWNSRDIVDVFRFLNANCVSKYDEFYDQQKIDFSIFKMYLLILKKYLSRQKDSKIKTRKSCIFWIWFFLNELNEQMNISKFQTILFLSKKKKKSIFQIAYVDENKNSNQWINAN